MDRFDRQPLPDVYAVPEERLARADDEIARLRARISTLEQTLETETRIRLETGTLLASEQIRTRKLEKQLAARQQEASRPAAAPAGSTRRWWRRPDLS